MTLALDVPEADIGEDITLVDYLGMSTSIVRSGMQMVSSS